MNADREAQEAKRKVDMQDCVRRSRIGSHISGNIEPVTAATLKRHTMPANRSTQLDLSMEKSEIDSLSPP